MRRPGVKQQNVLSHHRFGNKITDFQVTLTTKSTMCFVIRETLVTQVVLGHTIDSTIDSGIGLSITIDKIRVFINKTLSILSPYQ